MLQLVLTIILICIPMARNNQQAPAKRELALDRFALDSFALKSFASEG